MKPHTVSPLVVAGEITVDGAKYPHLRRAVERGKTLLDQHLGEWARVAELRRTGQTSAAEKLLRDLLGIKPEPMSEETKSVLRAKRAAMTDEEKRAEREKRKADRVLKRLAARAAGKGNPNPVEDAMAKKSVAKSVKGAKAAAKVKPERKSPPAKKGERDPRLPAPGTTFTREYKGKSLQVKVLEAGFQFEGEQFPSLTALALKITGAKAISGPRFFNLDQPKPVEAK